MKTLTLFWISCVVFMVMMGLLWLIFGGGTPEPRTASADSPGTEKTGKTSEGESSQPSENGVVQTGSKENEKPVVSDEKMIFDYGSVNEGAFAKVAGADACRAGILIDLQTGKVLWEKASKDPFPMASMTKLMTALLVDEIAAKDKKLGYDKVVKVTREAVAVSVGEVWLDARESFTVEKLLQAALIRSANDCALLLAQVYGDGKEKNFVGKMNARAKALGMTSSRFYNSNGLPGSSASSDNVGSAQDMVLLAREVLKHPKLMEIAKTERETLPSPQRKAPTELLNSNRHLLRQLPGCDGLKTGYTDRAGSCVTVSVLQNNKRYIGVVFGFPGSRVRDQFVLKLFEVLRKSK